MNTEKVNQTISKQCQDFIAVCPHCGTKAHLELIHNDHHMARNGDQYNYITFRCKPCQKLSIRVFHSTQNQYSDDQKLTPNEWVASFPSSNTTPAEKFIEFAPETVVGDYAEGLVCLANGANKAAVSMFRRSIQNAMVELGADEKLDLIDQIKAVEGLTKDIRDWAHNIRIFGNWGSHPQDDMLRDVTPELASEVKEFVDEFMNYVYVMPGKIQAARGRYQKKDEDVEDKGVVEA
ncbi:DUF4145 domain-containing protein [Candidatus Saccharibacteria bacterium]|nr:DUF4145 domain-containing protein [Candidatus Saccharibacteria bacterium]